MLDRGALLSLFGRKTGLSYGPNVTGRRGDSSLRGLQRHLLKS